MARIAIALTTALVAGCAPSPTYVARYDLAEIARETTDRNASPGFTAIPRTAAKAPAG